MDRETLDTLIPLLPAPRRLEHLGSGRASIGSDPTIILTPETMTRPAEYELVIGRTISITAGGAEGLRCAQATLDQIRSLSLDTVPAIRVHDWAAFASRGFMLDVSRDRIPTMPELHALIRLLASLKFNHFQLYFEHTFAYAGHETVWKDLDPITPEQFQELDKACQTLGIELVAQQNCFGHLANWLRHDRYAHLAETHGAYQFNTITRTGPMSLCPTDPRSLELVTDWITQLRQTASGTLLHIGCDETADVGAGRSRSAVDQRGLAAVYAPFVSSVAGVCQSLGFRPMFWADIALTEPTILDQLPKNLLAMAWGYEPATPFAAWTRTLCAAGFETWVCPGTSCWRSITGRTSERLANISSAARDGQAEGATGFMLTAWGDLGHRQQWPITLRALADGAQAAWADHIPTSDQAITKYVFAEQDARLVLWLDRLGDVDLDLRKANPESGRPRLHNASTMFNELHPADPNSPPRGSLADWQHLQKSLEELRASMPMLSTPLFRQELVHTLRRAELAVRIARLRRGEALSAEAIERDFHAMMDEHRSLWAHRARPAGLSASLSYDEAVLKTLRSP